jgi:hypothetical protein
MKTPPPFGVPVIIHYKSLLIACICRFPDLMAVHDLMIAVHDPTGYIEWNVRNPKGAIQYNFDSWELLPQKDLPLLISYEYKWPLFEELLNGTTPFPT